HELANLPQHCLRSDRLSVYEQDGLPFDQAMANEFQRGMNVLRTDAGAGAQRFAGGAGRHGAADTSDAADTSAEW
ncbi:MAG: enoyl-CoA hydratase, partial [Nitrososphaerota archaeon]